MTTTLRLKKQTPDHPWIFFDQLSNPSALVTALPTDIAHVYDAKNNFLGSAFLDIESKLCARIFSHKRYENIDVNFYKEFFTSADKKRSTKSSGSFYRLVNYEGDNLGGLAIDRFNDIFVVTTTIPVHEIMIATIVEALKEIFSISAVIHKCGKNLEVFFGAISAPVIVPEKYANFETNLLSGQKGGYYFDQAHNHEIFASYAQNKTVLDAYCYIGGFGLNALGNGAKHVTFVDSSSTAIAQLKQNLSLNSFDKNAAEILEDDVVKFLESTEKTFDMIALDPPPLIKDKSAKQKALKAYEKIMKLGLSRLNKNGILLFSSCSHHMKMSELKNIASNAAKFLGVSLRVAQETSHNFDHPINSKIPETRYLNTMILELYD